MPPSLVGQVTPESREEAPPWEKPPSTIRSEGMPDSISLAIKEWKRAWVRFMPVSSSFCWMSSKDSWRGVSGLYEEDVCVDIESKGKG